MDGFFRIINIPVNIPLWIIIFRSIIITASTFIASLQFAHLDQVTMVVAGFFTGIAVDYVIFHGLPI